MSDDKDLANTAVERTIEEGFTAAKEFLATIGGDSCKQVGGILGDQFRYWRFLNVLRLVDKVAARLRARGVDPRQVLPPTLVPLLESASLEENENLQKKWESMLANAVDPAGVDVTPSYPDILKRLTPLEVAILDWLSEQPPVEDPFLSGVTGAPQIRMVKQADAEQRFVLKFGQFELVAAHLHGIGICEAGHSSVVIRSGWSSTSSRFYNSIRLTPFGEAFVAACTYDGPASL